MKERLESVRMHGSAPEPGSLGTRAAPPGAGQAGAPEGGESELDWTKDLDYAADLTRHLRHRPIAAALTHDPDGGGPPGAGWARASWPADAASLVPSTARQPQGLHCV
jgi:hypothetical protein